MLQKISPFLGNVQYFKRNPNPTPNELVYFSDISLNVTECNVLYFEAEDISPGWKTIVF